MFLKKSFKQNEPYYVKNHLFGGHHHLSSTYLSEFGVGEATLFKSLILNFKALF